MTTTSRKADDRARNSRCWDLLVHNWTLESDRPSGRETGSGRVRMGFGV